MPAPAAASGGSTVGYCLMIGASRPRPSDGASRSSGRWRPPDGYAHVGPPGAGHYVKMIHNGIEYGMLQAYAEGYEILHASKDFELDLHQIAALWNRGSVVRSWLNELAERAFEKDVELAVAARLRGGLRRGSLDGAGGDRPRRASPGHHPFAADPVPLPPSRFLRCQGHRGAPQRVRRARGEERYDGPGHGCGSRRSVGADARAPTTGAVHAGHLRRRATSCTAS